MVRPILVLAGCVSGLACFGVLSGAWPWQVVEVRAATPLPATAAGQMDAMAGASPAASARRSKVRAGDPREATSDLVEFREQLVSGSAVGHAAFTRDELARTFEVKDDGGAEPGARTTFLDLQGDGREDGIVVLGDGWWGKHFDLCHFVPTASGFVLAAHQRFGHVTRGTPAVRALAAPRAGFLELLCHDGWGTGYQTTCMRVVEVAGTVLTEVACIPHSGEILCGGAGPVLEYGCTRVEIVASATGSALLLDAAYRVDFTTEGFGEILDTATVEFEARWAQPVAGGAFVLAVSGGFAAVDNDAFWCLGSRAWLTQHAQAVRGIPRLDDAQLRQLHRICDIAEEGGPCPDAAALRAAIPPPAVR